MKELHFNSMPSVNKSSGKWLYKTLTKLPSFSPKYTVIKMCSCRNISQQNYYNHYNSQIISILHSSPVYSACS